MKSQLQEALDDLVSASLTAIIGKTRCDIILTDPKSPNRELAMLSKQGFISDLEEIAYMFQSTLEPQ